MCSSFFFGISRWSPENHANQANQRRPNEDDRHSQSIIVLTFLCVPRSVHWALWASDWASDWALIWLDVHIVRHHRLVANSEVVPIRFCLHRTTFSTLFGLYIGVKFVTFLEHFFRSTLVKGNFQRESHFEVVKKFSEQSNCLQREAPLSLDTNDFKYFDFRTFLPLLVAIFVRGTSRTLPFDCRLGRS